MPNTDSPKKPRRRASTPPVPTTATDSASSTHVPQSAPTSGSDNAVPFSPTYDEIAQAAYQRYLDRGASDGADVDDWIAAERALKHGR
jgi:hypothetical protein